MRIILFGDSITAAGRNLETDNDRDSYGYGYVNFIVGNLTSESPAKYEIYNRGISGNRIVDLYARIKADVWNLQPDVLSILIGINDIWHEVAVNNNGVDIVRFERVYRMILDDTLERLPNIKFVILEPFVLKGSATEAHFAEFDKIRDYAKVVKKIAEEYHATFVPLQAKFDELAKSYDPTLFLCDGVHPSIAGAKVLADEWLKSFKKEIEK
ncbi:MAG: SGNH/GDSL hydrolase family protein [Clostridia bacterium]|nr:SGNH/GDSL hydrolase family protein [Clostridia bacterium]